MGRATKFTLLFVLIFLGGVLGFITTINRCLDQADSLIPIAPEEEFTYIK